MQDFSCCLYKLAWGVGKPEPLKHALSGFWSRRITDAHRMIYKVEGDALCLAQLRYRY
ncbi:Txe/YoeB family toxin of toxin-antitoxin system [Polaromonas sp. CG_9.5]|uniref:Txe/YoeB family addiction module toxin n=1 Tax=Polaromonas sp. CG_9.5 TaxID=3071705 RepID=UPI002DF794BD|nr:Txe/YoeB family toxin of toxin-antitoxin system [Polaromonas sp. CG_9.5]